MIYLSRVPGKCTYVIGLEPIDTSFELIRLDIKPDLEEKVVSALQEFKHRLILTDYRPRRLFINKPYALMSIQTRTLLSEAGFWPNKGYYCTSVQLLLKVRSNTLVK